MGCMGKPIVKKYKTNRCIQKNGKTLKHTTTQIPILSMQKSWDPLNLGKSLI